MVTQMKGYFLNAYHCWAFLAGHLSCYKYFFLPDVHYKCKLFCNQRGRLNTFYFESKKKRRFQDALKHSEYFSPTRTCLQPWSQKECIQQEVHIFCWSQTLLCGKPHLNKKKTVRENARSNQKHLQSGNLWLSQELRYYFREPF